MLFHVFLVVQVVITLAMVGMILLQRSDADGLAGLSGGGGNAFMTGRGAANFLTRATGILATLFMLNSLFLAIMSTQGRQGASIADSIVEENKPATAAPATAGEKTEVAPADAAPAAPADTTTTAPVEEAAPVEESKPSVPTPE